MREMHPVIDVATAMRIPMTASITPIVEAMNGSDQSRYRRQAEKSHNPSSRTTVKHSDTATGVIAAQLRRQGIACTFPRHARRNSKSSQANEVVWTLRCEEASYRVRLIPHIGARVTRIGDDQKETRGKQNADMKDSTLAVEHQPAR